MIPWRRWFPGLALALGGVLLVAAPGGAGVLDASWTAPTTNTDGNPLTDLASYRVYYGTSNPPCPGSSFFEVASSTASPPANQTVTFGLTGLFTGTLYYVSVTAVDMSGNESACSTAASAVARIGFAVSPTGTVEFGSVNLGSSADRTFTVQSTGAGTVSGTASTSAPFSIVSGSPFSLVGSGATQTVTVRFTPTAAATATVNVNFTADGDTISRIVTGTGTDATAPTDPTYLTWARAKAAQYGHDPQDLGNPDLQRIYNIVTGNSIISAPAPLPPASAPADPTYLTWARANAAQYGHDPQDLGNPDLQRIYKIATGNSICC